MNGILPCGVILMWTKWKMTAKSLSRYVKNIEPRVFVQISSRCKNRGGTRCWCTPYSFCRSPVGVRIREAPGAGGTLLCMQLYWDVQHLPVAYTTVTGLSILFILIGYSLSGQGDEGLECLHRAGLHGQEYGYFSAFCWRATESCYT